MPVKLFRLVAVIVDVCVDPAGIVRDEGLAVMEKSGETLGETPGVGLGEI